MNAEAIEERTATEAIVVSPSTMGAIARSEVEAQLAAAHRFPRSPAAFLQEAETLATLSVETAEACIFTVPREGKLITGPSIRLAEICAHAWGNLHIASRIVDEDERTVTAQGACWDLQKNLRMTIEVQRKITGKRGRYSDDMVITTGNAAASIARRNAIFSVVPRAYINQVFEKVRAVAVGNAETLADRRAKVVERLQKRGVPPDRIFARLGVKGIEDVDLEKVTELIGLGTALKNGEGTIDELFPPVTVGAAPAAPADDGKRISIKGAPKPVEPPPPPAPKEAPREPGSDG